MTRNQVLVMSTRSRRAQGRSASGVMRQFSARSRMGSTPLLVKELLKKADVTVENMAPGTIARLGPGYDEVKKINPRIIFCQIQGFGTGSKYENGLAFDMIAQAAGGTISVT